MRLQFDEYINEAIANKQVNVSLDTDKMELIFQLRGLFPQSLIQSISKAIKGKGYRIDKDEFKIYL